MLKDKLLIWYKNKLINPFSNRKIKLNGPTYKKLEKMYKKKYNEKIKRNYLNHRINKIDPILLQKLPLNNFSNKNLFEFKFKWNPYNGNRLDIDNHGSLYFDPETLINYFYVNRLNNLWINSYYSGDFYIQGYYGDAVGNGPDFVIKSRGSHPDWYLFRLPILDEYLNENHCNQVVTMGPILNLTEINNLDTISCNKKFKKMYKYTKPNLTKMFKIYEKCISKNEKIKNIYGIDIIEYKYNLNIIAIEQLKKYK